MSVDCIPEVVRTRRQYPAAPPNHSSRKNRPDGRFFVGYQDKREDPVTARKTRSSYVWSVELYFGIDVCFWPLDNNFIQKLPL